MHNKNKDIVKTRQRALGWGYQHNSAYIYCRCEEKPLFNNTHLFKDCPITEDWRKKVCERL